MHSASDDILFISNREGAEFVKHWLVTLNEKRSDEKHSFGLIHFILNLPGSAMEMVVPLFQEYLFKPCVEKVVVHVYTFLKSSTAPHKDSAHKLQQYLGCVSSVQDLIINTHIVRDVGPRKTMMCISFCLTQKTAVEYEAHS